MNAIFESLKIMQKAIAKAVSPESGICPDCGSNNLQHEAGMLMSEDWSGFSTYKFLEDPGWYRCENGHQFKVKWDEQNERFYIK